MTINEENLLLEMFFFFLDSEVTQESKKKILGLEETQSFKDLKMTQHAKEITTALYVYMQIV